MELDRNGNYLVDRDEARVIKKAAHLLGDEAVSRTCAHYLGVRIGSTERQGVVKLDVRRDELNNKYLQEAQELPDLIVKVGDTPSVLHMRYVYSPDLAKKGADLVAEAASQNMYTSELDICTARRLVDSMYEDTHTN